MTRILNAKLLVAFLALSTLGGCIYHDYDDHGPARPAPVTYPGDVTLSWSFGGYTCSQAPEVRGVHVVVNGEVLENDGYFPCLVDGYPGITLYDFVPGAYSYSVEAYGWDDQTLYFASGSFVVNGDVRASLDLTPVGQPSSYAYISWYFPANDLATVPSCSQAKVRYVDVRIDDGQWERFDCELGFAQPGIQTGYLQPGLHSIELVALDSLYEYPTHYFYGTLTTQANAPVASDYQLQWNVGGAAISWELTNGSTAETCSQAGVSHVTVHLMDEQGNWIYGSSGDVHSCSSAPIVYKYLQPGNYRVYLEGQGPNATWYLSNDAAPPVISVQAGVFPPASGALRVQMFEE